MQAPVAASANIAGDQEYVMTQKDFDQMSELALSYTGIVLGPHKITMVYSRIARRLRILSLPDFSSYLIYLNQNFDQEIHEFINHITTNLTSFFRESHHFDFCRDELFPQFIKQRQKRIRIWSSGCSNGQEAYSIAMTIRQCAFPISSDIKILATDLDSNMVQQGQDAIYPIDSVDSMSPAVIEKYCQKSRDGNSIRIRDNIRQLVYFKRLNLLESWPVKGPFDAIFCRNVVIYFNKETQKALFDRYANLLPVGGHLFIGHSESLNGITDRFESIGHTIYRKIR